MKNIFHTVLVSALAGWSCALMAAPADPRQRPERGSRRTIHLAPTPGAIDVDGQLTDVAWQAATPVPLPFEVAPGENVTATFETLCRMAYDTEHLYVGCEASDPQPAAIRAYYSDRDLVDGQDRIVVTLDPFDDSRRAWQFGVTALGVQYDGTVTQEGQQASVAGRLQGDAAWDAIWHASARVTSTGYVIEIAIPFRALRFPPATPDRQWGIVIARFAPRDRDFELRSAPWDRANACGLCQSSAMTGLEGISPGGLLQLTPSVTVGKTDVRRARSDADLTRGPIRAQPALDARWNVTSDLAAAATINPDFSQVEADALQLDVNTRFALFFPEKRPFFLDGAELLATPLRAVFTRTVADPIAGARVTGSVGGTTVGALVATDAHPNVLLPGSQFSDQAELTSPVTTVVARLRRDLGGSSSAGVLATIREGGEYANRVFGADALLRPTTTLTARVQLLGSTTTYPEELRGDAPFEESALNGVAGYASVRYAPRNWLAVADLQWMTPGVRLDTGFEPRVDVRTLNGSLRRRFWADGGGWFSELATGAGFWYSEDFNGRMLEQSLWIGGEYEGPWQSTVWAFLNFAQRERIDDPTPRFWTGFLRASAAPTRWFGAEMIVERGGAVDLLNRRLSDGMMLSPSITWRPGRHLQLRVNHTMRRLAHDGVHVFTAHGSETRATYNLNARTFLRAVVQYESTSRNRGLHPAGAPPSDRRLAMQWHYSYKLNPQTVLFLGYGDGREAMGDLSHRLLPLVPADRTFFMKVGYAWRL